MNFEAYFLSDLNNKCYLSLPENNFIAMESHQIFSAHPASSTSSAQLLLIDECSYLGQDGQPLFSLEFGDCSKCLIQQNKSNSIPTLDVNVTDD